MADIHPTAIVAEGASIGAGCSVGPYSCIGPDVTLGENCRIGPHAVIDGCTTLGRGNVVYQFASVGAAPQDLKWKGGTSRLEIGDDNIIREYVTVQPGLEQFGGLSGAHQFCRIGDHAFISAGSMVAQDVPPYCLVQGDRARLRGINRTGLQRAGFGAEDIRAIQRVFRMLFVSEKPLDERVAEVLAAYPDSVHAGRLVGFVRSSERGVVGYRRSLEAA